jgi:hypothetical protein
MASRAIHIFVNCTPKREERLTMALYFKCLDIYFIFEELFQSHNRSSPAHWP